MRVPKLLSFCFCLKSTENSDTRFALLDENELQQLSNRWRNEDTICSTKLGLILTKLGQFNGRRMLI